MARKRDPRRDKAFEMWKSHKGDITNRAIAEELDVPEKTISAWKSRDKWNAVLQKNECSTTNKEQDISWVKIENEYVTDIRKKPCTLKDLAIKYGISYDYIRQYASDADWKEKRKLHLTNASQKTAEKSAELISNDLSKVTARHFDISDKLLGVLEKSLQDENQFYMYVEKLRTGEGQGYFSEEIAMETLSTLNESKLLSVVNTLEKLQKMQRQTLDILDAKDMHKIEMDYKKLDGDEEVYEDDGFEDALNAVTSEVWANDNPAEEDD
jgi:phage terminase small subunit